MKHLGRNEFPFEADSVRELAYVALGVAAILVHDPPLSHKSAREVDES